MLEAIWYGLVAALTFVGFISIIYFVVLCIYKPKGNGRYILVIPEKAKKDEISNLIYGAHMRNMLFGDLVSDEIYVVDCGLDDERKQLVEEVSKEYGGVNVCRIEELADSLYRKDNNGAGAC